MNEHDSVATIEFRLEKDSILDCDVDHAF